MASHDAWARSGPAIGRVLAEGALLTAENRRYVLARAETVLYDHLVVTPGGLCVGCSEPEPCHARYAALAVFNEYGVLPRRRPGVTGIYMADGTGSFDGFAAAQRRSS